MAAIAPITTLSNSTGNGTGTAASASPTTATHPNGTGITYSDPEADVTLKSSEGRNFKVESYVLKTHSTYFRNLFKSSIPSDPIPIDAPTKLLKLTLDLMHIRSVPPAFIWAYRERLLKLCDTLGLASVAERVLFSMHDTVEKDPWAVFCLASQRGNTSLAKAALKAMPDHSDTPSPKVGALTTAQAEKVALPYLLGLFNAALKDGPAGADGFDGDSNASTSSVSWKVIAERFTPVVG